MRHGLRGWAVTIVPSLWLALTASAVSAQSPDGQLAQNLKKLSIEELTQLDITTASRRVEPLAQAAAAVSVIRGEDIRRAGATNLAEALRLADGIQVARADNQTWAISTRGFNIPTANKILSIARRLVDLHGGRIHVSSEGRGRGATFTVRLPVRTPAAAPPDEGSIRTAFAAVGGKLAGLTVLTVDDEPDALEMMVSVLEGAGATVLAATSADEALRLAVANPPDVLVSDLGMPGTDGYSLMAQMRATLGDEAPRITVALTAYASERDRERSALAGYQRHLAKPIDPLELVDLIAVMLRTEVQPGG